MNGCMDGGRRDGWKPRWLAPSTIAHTFATVQHRGRCGERRRAQRSRAQCGALAACCGCGEAQEQCVVHLCVGIGCYTLILLYTRGVWRRDDVDAGHSGNVSVCESELLCGSIPPPMGMWRAAQARFSPLEEACVAVEGATTTTPYARR